MRRCQDLVGVSSQPLLPTDCIANGVVRQLLSKELEIRKQAGVDQTASSAGLEPCTTSPLPPAPLRYTTRCVAEAPPGASTTTVSSSCKHKWENGGPGEGGNKSTDQSAIKRGTIQICCNKQNLLVGPPPATAQTTMPAPALVRCTCTRLTANSPRRMPFASAVSSSCCTTRFTGRAPNAGS